jgi:hypothetical protein
MKIKIFFVLLSIFCIGKSLGQTVYGKIVDASTGEALEYVNIGVIGKPQGTVTDKTGDYQLIINGLSAEATVRISMIGYSAQIFTVAELSENNGKTIKLESTPVLLSEVVVKPGKPANTRKVGTLSCSAGVYCGWGGVSHGKGNEVGVKIGLGELPVSVKSLHVRLFKQSYDSCFLRIHVRNIMNELPGDELLNQNIIFPITQESGWVVIDLSVYHLEFQGDIILSLEWVGIRGVKEKRLFSVLSIGEKTPPNSVILKKKKKNHGATYTRWGSEAPWVSSKGAPSFYLTVM